MNIVFLLKTLGVGGVEVVTVALANTFVTHGHKVTVFAFGDCEGSGIADRLADGVEYVTGNGQRCSAHNVDLLKRLMLSQQTDVVINQWGLPMYLLKTARKAAVGRKVKFISVYHNAPDRNGRLQEVDNLLAITTNPLKKKLLCGKRWLFKQITAYSMRCNYRHSDCYMVLSDSFIEKFKTFSGIKDATKLVVQTNPITIETPKSEIELTEKHKEVIFVGRIDKYQKRVERIIKLWQYIEPRYPDWKLSIIGDGEERESVEKLSRALLLRNIRFEGFKHPVDYYRRASILLLTSDFEGFGLVIVEGMSYGVVPVVYGSYSAIYDIVESGKDGIIVPPTSEGGYDAGVMARSMEALMNRPSSLERMAREAVITSKRYDIETIYEQWMEKMAEMCNIR